MSAEKVEKLTSNEWVNLFKTTYKDKSGDERDWIFASRKDDPAKDRDKVDAVVIVPLCIMPNADESFVVINNQLRPATGNKTFEFPAGLIEPKFPVFVFHVRIHRRFAPGSGWLEGGLLRKDLGGTSEDDSVAIGKIPELPYSRKQFLQRVRSSLVTFNSSL